MAPVSSSNDAQEGLDGVVNGAAEGESEAFRRVALLGNPNTGKTTLFNRLSGLRHKTSNFPGTTLEARVARVKAGVEGGRDAELIDLPGIYSLELEQIESSICREVLAGQAAPRGEPMGAPEVCVVVVDGANLARNMMLVGEVFRRRLPTVIVVNMIDLVERAGIRIDAGYLRAVLGCGVFLTNARDGRGISEARVGIREAKIPTPVEPVPNTPQALSEWATKIAAGAQAGSEHGHGTADAMAETTSDRIDRVLLHPVSGIAVFAVVMTILFYTIFAVARFPMDWIGGIFDFSRSLVEAHMPEGALRELLADGVIGGVGATVVFLPQICLLFFLISVLEDTGYLARGAFLMDRLLRPFGLPGHAFVPLLSSHACALPGIMATRAIPDRRERLATILVAPFMTCSARLPVYVLITTLLFKDRPVYAALAFVGCYALGILAGVLSALIARRTVLRGPSRPMAMELPSYKRPSLRTALVTTVDRGWTFIRNAGTNILVICIVLWWLGAYPKVAPPAEATLFRQNAANVRPDEQVFFQATPNSKPSTYSQAEAREHIDALRERAERARKVPEGLSPEYLLNLADKGERRLKWAADVTGRAREWRDMADRVEARNAKAHSFLGVIGRGIQPVFQPLGFDWQLTVGVLASFAAREVFVSTMNVVIAGQEKADGEEDEHLMQQIQDAKRSDGVTPIFTPAASWSLLVFFVLAMQCLPTLAVTAKESGSAKWALLQLGWMSGIAYVAAMVVYQVMR